MKNKPMLKKMVKELNKKLRNKSAANHKELFAFLEHAMSGEGQPEQMARVVFFRIFDKSFVQFIDELSQHEHKKILKRRNRDATEIQESQGQI